MKRRGSVLLAMVIMAVVLALNTQSGAMSSPASPEKERAPGIASVMYVFKSLSNQPASVRLPSDNPSPQPVWSVSHDDALNDIDLLFETLRYGYAGYELAEGEYRDSAGRVLTRVDGCDPGSRLLRSVSSSGLIVYVIGALSSEKHQNSVVELEFADGDHEMAWLVPAMPLAPDGGVYSLAAWTGTAFQSLPCAHSELIGM